VYLDTNNNGVLDSASTTTVASTNVPRSIPDNRTSGTTSTLTFSGPTAPIADVNITFSITHTRDADLTAYLIGPDGTQVTLFSKVGGTGQNFTNTTLDDQASTSITVGTAPFTGTYQPSPGLLSAFNGRSAVGTWSFKVVDSRRNNTGSITAWSLAVTTAGEASTVTGAGGAYSFSNVTPGTYYVRELTPAGEVQTWPNPGATPVGAYTVAVSGQMSGKNFGLFPTAFTASGPVSNYYVRLDPSQTYLQISTSASPLTPPTYQVTLSLLPSLTLNLAGATGGLYVDYSNGSPVPTGGLVANAASGSADALHMIGASTSQTFTLTDSQIAPAAGGGAVAYQNFQSLWLNNCTVNYSGSLAGFQDLYIGAGTVFNWG
jgi:subtilisin-like proprotein convertase family protein